MAVTLERIIDKIEAQWPIYAGIGIAGYIGWQIIKRLQSKETGQSEGSGRGGAKLGKVG